MVSRCLFSNGVARGKTCPHLVLKMGKKLVLWPGHNTEARFAVSPVCLLLLQLNSCSAGLERLFFPLDKNRKIMWVKWGVQHSIQGS